MSAGYVPAKGEGTLRQYILHGGILGLQRRKVSQVDKASANKKYSQFYKKLSVAIIGFQTGNVRNRFVDKENTMF